MPKQVTEQPNWWGEYTLEVGQCLQIEIGTAKLAILRQAHEWQLYYNMVTDTNDNGEGWQVSIETGVSGEFAIMERYVYSQTGPKLTILPMLADRPVVTRPLSPFHLPSGEEVTLYVSTPLWLQVSPGEVPTPVQAVPIYRPSDTWFGPSTLKGDLCYASLTHGRLSLDEVPLRPHRAITPVLIRNQAGSALALERLNLPVPYLSLYVSDDGHLWTEPVTMLRANEKDNTSLDIGKTAPLKAHGASLVMSPREAGEKSILTSTFSTLFG